MSGEALTGVVSWRRVPAGDGQRREELLPGHAQTDQEEDQRVHEVPPGAARRLHPVPRRPRADGPVEAGDGPDCLWAGPHPEPGHVGRVWTSVVGGE